jgi:hypothetical protein
MAWANTQQISERFVKILSDNRVLPSEWKYAIPLFIVQNPITVVINAKNFADGIQHNIEKYGIQIPSDKLAYDEYSVDYLMQ